MSLIPFKHWATLPWIIIIGSMQAYIFYSSIFRYVKLKSEVFNGFYNNHKEFDWVLSLLFFQLLSIIISLGIFPLWLYSTLFSSSSFFCGRDLLMTKKGFYQLVWNEAVDFLYTHVHRQFDDLVQIERTNSKTVRVTTFFPISNILHVSMAYLLILPVPFMDAWFIHTDDKRKEMVWSHDLEFIASSSFIIKIKCSVEYFNFFFSLLNFSFQFSKLLWSCNKYFSILLNIIQILVTFHIVLSFSLFSIFIKFYYKNIQTTNVFIPPFMILLIASISNILLILTSFSYFQFGFEKCVQYLLRNPWFNIINRSEIIPLSNNYEQSNCQSTTSSSAYFSSRMVVNTKNGICHILSSAGFFILAIILRTFECYDYWYNLESSYLFMIYFANYLILIVFYFMMWFGMCLKLNWNFKLTEKELSQYAIITYPEKMESNDYKSFRSHQGNSQISLSLASNTNYSNQSKKRDLPSKIDVTMNNNQYLSHCSRLNPSLLYKSQLDSNEYLKLNHSEIQSNMYKSIYGSNTLNESISPTQNFKRTLTPNYKCSTPPSYSILRSNESARSDESEEIARKLSMGYPIQEELYNESDISSEEEILTEEQLKSNGQLKFVTFQLDKTPKLSPELNSSNDNLTIGSLDTTEKFIKELEKGTDMKIGYTSFKDNKNMNANVSPYYILENTSTNKGRIQNIELNL